MDTASAAGQGSGDDSELTHLGQRLCEALHQLNLKRSMLETTRLELHASYLAKHELERALERERRDAQEVRLQLELTMKAAQCWEQERAGVKEAGSRQRVQLHVVTAERDALQDHTRDLQLENMKLQRQIEEEQAQLRCQVSYHDNSVVTQNKLRSMQHQINTELRQLQLDHERLEKVFEAAHARTTEALITVEHRNSMQQRADQERLVLEDRIAKLGVQMDTMLLSSTKAEPSDTTVPSDLAGLQELVKDMEQRLESEFECSANLAVLHQASLQQQTAFEKLEKEAREMYNAEKSHCAQLIDDNNTLNAEICLLKENISSLEQTLNTERKLACKAECVEQGVQCDVSDLGECKSPEAKDNEELVPMIT